MSSPIDTAGELLSLLERKGGVCTLSQLGAKESKLPARKRAALDELLAAGRVLKRKAGIRTYFVLPGSAPTVESEQERILDLFKDSVDLKPAKALKASRHLDDRVFRTALESLVDKRLVMCWDVARHKEVGLVYGLTSTVQRQSAAANAASPSSVAALAPPPSAADIAPRIHAAYKRIAAATHYPDVYISEIQKESGVPMETLKEWLRENVIKRGRGMLSSGDWAACSAEQRSGFVEHLGERRLLVRLLP